MLNADKLIEEFGAYGRVWRNPPPPTHPGGGLPNRFVEAARTSAYAAGHLELLMSAVIVALSVLLVVHW
jgi:hypothetical protein